MKNNILKKILQLDSIFHFLSWDDRIRIHLYMLERFQSTTPHILAVYEWITKNEWSAPEMRYGQDRLLYFEIKEDQWEPVENYQCENINQLIKNE